MYQIEGKRAKQLLGLKSKSSNIGRAYVNQTTFLINHTDDVCHMISDQPFEFLTLTESLFRCSSLCHVT